MAAIPNYRRNFVTGGFYFFTLNLLERQQTLLTDHIDLLRDSVQRVRRLYPFHIDAWLVLPDHLYCVLTLPPDTKDFPVLWCLIKLFFSNGLPRTERLSATHRKRVRQSLKHIMKSIYLGVETWGNLIMNGRSSQLKTA